MDLSAEETFEVLERTPGALRALLDGLSDPWLLASEGPETFSPKDVVGHLIHGEETDWVPRLRIILEHGEAKPFTPFDRFAFREKYAGWRVDRLLDRFALLRRENLGLLRGMRLDAAALARTGSKAKRPGGPSPERASFSRAVTRKTGGEPTRSSPSQ